MTEEAVPGADGALRIPVVEERLAIGKETIETGRVRIASRIVDDVRQVDETVESVRVRIERIAVDRLVDTAPPVRTQQGRTIISVTEEVLVKRIRVVEEVHLIEERITTPYTQDVTLRRTEIDITRD